jgi:predicted MFS family arabinose efflux permease
MTPADTSEQKLPATLLLRIFVPFGLGYFLSYVFRAVNAVIEQDLTRDIGLNAAEVGLLTSVYFLAFALFQLPLGVLLDRFGPRRTEATLLVVAAAGAALFAVAEDMGGLILGRALIGLGVSACLMASFKAFVLWFPKQHLPLANGIIMTAGGLGAIAATAPVEMALQFTDWRALFSALAGATLLVGALLFLTVPDRSSSSISTGWQNEFSGVRQVFFSRAFWRVAPVTLMSQATFLSIQSLWAGPWLRDVAGMDRTGVADALLVTAISMVAGFLLMGYATERAGRHGIQPMVVAVGGMSIFVCAQGALVFAGLFGTGSSTQVMAIWALFGFFGTIGIIPYAALAQTFPAHLAGRVTTALNFLVFMAAFAGQAGIGAIISFWKIDGNAGYEAAGYVTAFAIMIGLQALGLCWYAIDRKSGLRP